MLAYLILGMVPVNLVPTGLLAVMGWPGGLGFLLLGPAWTAAVVDPLGFLAELVLALGAYIGLVAFLGNGSTFSFVLLPGLPLNEHHHCCSSILHSSLPQINPVIKPSSPLSSGQALTWSGPPPGPGGPFGRDIGPGGRCHDDLAVRTQWPFTQLL